MKIVKGVAIYTLLILGALAVFAMLLVGCMFMFPNFDVFGWKVIFKSNEKALTYGAKSASYAVDSGEYYTVNIDAGMHSVYIHQWANQGILESEIDYVYVEKIDDMFGLYTGDYNNQLIKPEDSEAAAKNVINIKLGGINGAVMGRKSRLDVYLPCIAGGYNLKIKTTTGSININGAATKTDNLNVTGLEVSTTTGDFSWSDVRTSAINNAGDSNIYTGSKVGSIDTGDKDYKKEQYERFVFLNNFRASTVSGNLDFSLAYADAIQTSIAPTTAGGVSMYDVLGGKFANNDAGLANWLNSLGNDEESGFYVDVERGDVKFSKVIAPKFNVVGTDVLIEAKNITSLSNFYFNVPNGVFKIEELESPLSTIITNNIDVNLTKSNGELSITTTYGNIAIGTINQNASLSSTHGNITVDKAYASISAISEYGDINVKAFRSKGYLKNKHGKINAAFDIAWYRSNTASIKATSENFTQKFEMYNEDGSITATNLVFETSIVNKGGNVTATFYEMANNKDANNYVSHSISLDGGSANVQISSLEAFKFKGKGGISGQIGGTNLVAGDEFVRILVPNEGSPEASLAHLEAVATNANIVFSAYFYEAPQA